MRPKRQPVALHLDEPNFCPAPPKLKRYYKKLARRARRRDGKINPHDALKQNRYRGWVS